MCVFFCTFNSSIRIKRNFCYSYYSFWKNTVYPLVWTLPRCFTVSTGRALPTFRRVEVPSMLRDIFSVSTRRIMVDESETLIVDHQDKNIPIICTPETVDLTTGCTIPEDMRIQQHHCGNLTSCKAVSCVVHFVCSASVSSDWAPLIL
jgi:hypothetical protein